MPDIEIDPDICKSETPRLTEELKTIRKESSYSDSITKTLMESVTYIESFSRWVVSGLIFISLLIIGGCLSLPISGNTGLVLLVSLVTHGAILVTVYFIVNSLYNGLMLRVLETTSLNIKDLENAEKLAFKSKSILMKGHKGVFLIYTGIIACSISVAAFFVSHRFLKDIEIKQWMEYGVIALSIFSITFSLYAIATITCFNKGKTP